MSMLFKNVFSYLIKNRNEFPTYYVFEGPLPGSEMAIFFIAFLSFFFFFRSHCMACRILVPQPGIEPGTCRESAES